MSVRLAHSVFGSAVGGRGKTPALILHGLFGSGNNWRALAGKLASETNRLVQFVIIFFTYKGREGPGDEAKLII